MRVADYKITFYGVDHEQFFPGHGVAFTHFTDCATGIGACNAEALDDALEQLAMAGWDVEALKAEIAARGTKPNDKPIKLAEGCYYYVGVSVVGEVKP